MIPLTKVYNLRNWFQTKAVAHQKHKCLLMPSCKQHPRVAFLRPASSFCSYIIAQDCS